jgi:tetratricopeptide (TPR) repeat protein
MTSRRHVVVVGGLFALAAVVTSSYLSGDPVDPARKGLRPQDRQAGDARLEKDPEAAFTQSRFAQGGILVYQPQEEKTNALFSWQLQPRALQAAPRRPRDMVFLISGSASMADTSWGAARQMAWGLAEGAEPGDRVDLWLLGEPKATRSFTNGLVPALGADKKLAKNVVDAFKSLAKNTPIGVTDLRSALNRVADSFDREGRQRILVYFGDGMSLLHPLNNAERNGLGKRLAERHIVFYPVPLGRNMEPANLHGLAAGTGGAPLRIHLLKESPKDAVQRAHAAFDVPILYPQSVKVPDAIAAYYPAALPPLRADSPTLFVGRFARKDVKGDLTLSVTGQVDGRPGMATVDLTAPVPASADDNFFLVSLVAQWQNAPAEHAMIRADRALVYAHEQARLEHQDLLVGAQLAMQQNQLEAAARLYEQARRLVPNDGEARAGLKLVARLQKGEITRDVLEKQLDKARQDTVALGQGGKVRRLNQQELEQLAQADKGEAAPPAVRKGGAAAPAPEDLLKQHRDRVVVEEQKMTENVNAALRQARRELAQNPEAAHKLLRDSLLLVEGHPDLGARVRGELVGRLENELREVALEGRRLLEVRAEQQKLADQAQKSLDRAARLQAEQDRIESRVRTYKGLMNLARYEETAMRQVMDGMQAMQREARVAGDRVPVVTQAVYDLAQRRFNLQKLDDLKALRAKRTLQVMMDVEKTFVPFSDEPPIHFPSLAYWKALVNLRKEKYEVQSLPDDPKGREEATKIYKLLEKDIDLKDVPEKLKLKDVLELISTHLTKLNGGKDVLILLDINAFKSENEDTTTDQIYGEEVEIPAFPKKMAVTTLLRVALGKLPTRNATYVIRKNFIEITTNDRVIGEKVLRVYPVGELVIPIKTQSFMGATGGGVGINGMGAMMGGMGMAGMGGMGMAGMGGMGMMGMGGMGMMGMGGMNMGMMGMGGGFNMMGMGMGGGFNMMGMGMGGMNMGMMGMGGMNMGMMGMGMGGMMMGQMMGGMGMMGQMMGGMGMMGMGGGGQFAGGNGNLGFMGATQANSLIMVITNIVAPGEWYKTPAQLAAEQAAAIPGFGFGGPGFMGVGFMGAGFMGAGFMGAGFMGAGFMGVGIMGAQGPPLPVQQGGPANIAEANTLQFFAPALALIVRGTTRLHYKSTGGVIGPKAKKVEQSALQGEERFLAQGPKNGGKVKVAGAEDGNDPAALAKKGIDLDPRTVWEKALRSSPQDPGLIIATADFLFDNEKYEHAAEFLKANLRLGIVVRPWVYESLAIAMEAAGTYTADEIRQARLSAVALDPHGPLGFLEAARALADQREWDRALAFCKQAAQREPGLPACYANALVYAERGRDADAMAWAAGHLLGRDWAGDNDGLHHQAQAKLEALAGTLTRQSRQAEADQLLALLEKMRQRDLVIRFSWEAGDSGPAEFELEVKEPGGSLCSSQLRQTPGGGTLLGGTLKQLTRTSYVAAQAYSGDYEVNLRRLWGQPLGGKVRVEVIQHQGTPEESRHLETLRIGQKHTFHVALTGGRRTAPAAVPPPGAAEQAEAAVKPQSSMRILRVLRDIAESDFSAFARGGIQGGFGAPMGSRAQPAVASSAKQSDRLAFQTAISSLGGVNLTTRTTVSADQRTMRVSLIPSFQQVGSSSTAVIDLPLIPGGTDR